MHHKMVVDSMALVVEAGEVLMVKDMMGVEEVDTVRMVEIDGAIVDLIEVIEVDRMTEEAQEEG